jgi:hypothetical protein
VLFSTIFLFNDDDLRISIMLVYPSIINVLLNTSGLIINRYIMTNIVIKLITSARGRPFNKIFLPVIL